MNRPDNVSGSINRLELEATLWPNKEQLIHIVTILNWLLEREEQPQTRCTCSHCVGGYQ